MNCPTNNRALAWLADEVEKDKSVSFGSERTSRMETTRYVVEYNTPASPASVLLSPVVSSICACLLHFMEVDATCAKDAVEAVLASHPNASIVAVKAQKTDYEKADTQ